MGESAADAGARRLSAATLRAIGERVGVPTYDRGRLAPAIVHLGVGGFHRAHQAMYLDGLAERRITSDWGLCGVGLLPGDRRMQEALAPQDCLYTVVQRSAETDEARVVGAMTRYLFAPDQRETVLATLAAAETRIVSLTITEGGYNIDQATGAFDAQDPAVREDLRHPSSPDTVFGYLCEALARRRAAGLPPFTVLSCDNLQGNGGVARRVITAFGTLRDEALGAWIAANVAFPNSMVDRITPQTTDADRAMVASAFGIEDAWPVVTEPFTQWIVEDQFANGRPPLEQVGVQFVADVHPYEMMKIRLLNASHSAMGFLGALCGFRYIHEVIADPQFRAFIARLMDDEVTPLLPPVPGVDLTAYKHTLIERFANPKIGDQVARICMDGSNRVPKFVVPSIVDALAVGGRHRLLTLALAGWFRFMRGRDDQGGQIAILEPRLDELQALASEGGEDPRPLLRVRQLFGDLGEDQAFVAELGEALHLLYAQGARAALAHYLAASGGYA